MGDISYQELVLAAQKGDARAFEELVRRHERQVAKIVRNRVPVEDVETVMQDVFVEAFVGLPKLREVAAFPSWLGIVAQRTCLGFWRTRYRKREIPQSALSERGQAVFEQLSSDPEDAADSKIEQHEAKQLLNRLLQELSAEDRMVVVSLHLEERSVKETAAMLGWSETNVKVRAFRARKRLEKALRKLESEKS